MIAQEAFWPYRHGLQNPTELSLSDNLGIESGDMHRMTETANWLSYCLREISKHVERADLLEETW